MTRKEFLSMCSILGIGLPLQAALSSCSEDPISNTNENIIIIGAGAAGLSAGYLLNQQGVNYQILEASANYGGRMKRTKDFADFPIPLGAEWLHVERGIFDEIINNASTSYEVLTSPYNPDVDYGLFEGQRVSIEDIGFTIDQKFINATWFDFFEQYIVPSVASQISFNTIVDTIDYSGDQILVKTATETFSADRVIISVPVKILQNGAINFVPELPNKKQNAIDDITVWDGCKAFIAFSEKFYPAFTCFDIQPETAGQKLYYDAAYGQNTNENILGLFAVGTGTLPYVQLSDSELISYMLSELDEIYDGKASATYIKHIFQNWNEEPFAKGAYATDHENWRTIRTLGESIDSKLFFAGDAYTDGSDWGSVHAAARSAKRAIEELVG
ncbi:MAG: FAD-dependent oxidoreductase [Bacteroidota bacterium]